MTYILAALAAWSTRHRAWVLGFLVLPTLLAAEGWRRLRFDFSNERLFASEDQARRTYEDFQALFGTDDNLIYLACELDNAFTPESLRFIEVLGGALGKVPHIRRVSSPATAARMWGLGPGRGAELERRALASPLVNRNLVFRDPAGDVAVFLLEIEPETNGDAVRREVMDALDRVLEDRGAGRVVHRSGIPVIQREYIRLLIADQLKFLPAVTILLVLVLWWILRDLRMVVACYATVALVMLWTGGAMGWAGYPVNVVNQTLPTLILVIGVADLVHLGLRARAEWRKANSGTKTSDSPAHAVEMAVREVGVACFMTSLTTAIGFGSLVFLDNPTLREYGAASAVGVLLAFVAAFSFFPVMLVSFVLPRDKRIPHPPFRRSMVRLGFFVNRRHGVVVGAFVVFTAACAAAAIAGLHVDNHLFEELRPDNPVARDHRWFEERLGGILPLELVLKMPAPLSAESEREALRVIEEAEAALRELAPVGGVISPATFRAEAAASMAGGASRAPSWASVLAGAKALGRAEDIRRYVSEDGRTVRVSGRCKALWTSELQAVSARLEERLRAKLPPGWSAVVTGRGVQVSAAAGRVVEGLAWSLAGAFVVISLAMTLLLGSWRAGLVSMLPNVFPIIVGLAAMSLLGVTVRISTMLIYTIALGIAVDDTIHFLTRFREERRPGVGIPDAVRRALAGSGPGMTATTVLNVLGYSVLCLSTFKAIAQFAMLGAVVLSAALAGDLLFLPALVLTLGWWEGRVTGKPRRHPLPEAPSPR